MNGLEVSGLTKSFDGATAVRDLDLAAPPGAFVALLGPSGCGKTTTLRLIAGFERPDAGEIRINGRDVRTLPPHRRDIGIVFQSYALFPHKTVFENIAYGLLRRKVARPELQARVREAIGGKPSAEELREGIRIALVGQGREYDELLVEQALTEAR